MAIPKTVYGVIRDGMVVLENPGEFAEGTWVTITPLSMEFTPEERAEFEAWDRLSDEAWAMIDEWEKNGFPDIPPAADAS